MKCKNNGCDNKAPKKKYKDKKTNEYRLAQCTECRSCTALRENYGITKIERDSLLEKQNSKCAICNSLISFIGKTGSNKQVAVVDHCHSKGHVRGILCGACNLMLGKVNDSIEILESSIEYLKNNK